VVRKLDEFDRKLLDIVQHDSTQNTEKLARRVGLSASAVQRRLNRLRENGVIEKEVAVVAPEAVGRPLLLIVNVRMASDRHDHIEAFAKAAADAPQITQCYYVTGSADFVLLVTARSMEDYKAFADRFFHEHNVVRYETTVVMRRIKAGLALPVA
jgi:Lrp/AsnC family leucine-responsive transcriptional regulator